jgi:hypothetical protein
MFFDLASFYLPLNLSGKKITYEASAQSMPDVLVSVELFNFLPGED